MKKLFTLFAFLACFLGANAITIVDADVILVVHDGRIIERGTHRELMMKKGYYYNLYTRQYEDLAVDMA